MSLEAAVARVTGRDVESLRRVGGGDINDAYVAELSGGGRAFVKTRADAPAGEYEAEAAALRWLGEPGGVGVPEVLGASGELLALEWLEEGGAGDEDELGRGLAIVHQAGAESYGDAVPSGGARPRGESAPGGAAAPLRIGRLALPNDPADGWPTFYAERRLRALIGPARLSGAGARAVEAVCDRIHDLAGPPEPPARLHGDLWSGNVLWSGGRPYVIDPIAYGGHREVDLAMLQLFGSPGPRFFAAYEDVAPLADGWRDRVPLYQLFPLLVHAALFGGGYAASVERAARKYAG
ncbi:MAG TPA: fructosamine kinase family protein [Solirubrobacteraceae bacterium]|nr:fructosamine kinase family protein [Solirubrobacteraceae bacterium]